MTEEAVAHIRVREEAERGKRERSKSQASDNIEVEMK